MRYNSMLMPKLVIDAKSMLGEGPWWDIDKKMLYWLDILNHELHFYDPKKNLDRLVKYDKPVSSIVPRKKGGFIGAFSDGIYFLYENGEIAEMIVNPENEKTGNRFNDGKCDPEGRFWIGSMDEGGDSGKGSLYKIEKNLAYDIMIRKCDISNGIVWNSKADRMYYTDTLSGEIWAYDYCLKDGTISNKMLAYKLSENEGLPDGMAIDCEDMIWAAVWGGGKVIRVNPENGEKLVEIYLPVPNVSAVSFGGVGLTDLYITSARLGLDEDQLRKYPLSGGLFRIDTGVKGAKLYKFGA